MDNENLLKLKNYIQELYSKTKEDSLVDVMGLIDELRTDDKTKEAISDYLDQRINKVKEVEEAERERLKKFEEEQKEKQKERLEKLNKQLETLYLELDTFGNANLLKRCLIYELFKQDTSEKSSVLASMDCFKRLGADGVIKHIYEFDNMFAKYSEELNRNWSDCNSFFSLIEELFCDIGTNYLNDVCDFIYE